MVMLWLGLGRYLLVLFYLFVFTLDIPVSNFLIILGSFLLELALSKDKLSYSRALSRDSLFNINVM